MAGRPLRRARLAAEAVQQATEGGAKPQRRSRGGRRPPPVLDAPRSPWRATGLQLLVPITVKTRSHDAEVLRRHAEYDVKWYARQFGPEAVSVLVSIMRDERLPAPARHMAAVAILDRGFGRPAPTHPLHDDVTPEYGDMDRGQLMELARQLGEEVREVLRLSEPLTIEEGQETEEISVFRRSASASAEKDPPQDL